MNSKKSKNKQADWINNIDELIKNLNLIENLDKNIFQIIFESLANNYIEKVEDNFNRFKGLKLRKIQIRLISSYLRNGIYVPDNLEEIEEVKEFNILINELIKLSIKTSSYKEVKPSLEKETAFDQIQLFIKLLEDNNLIIKEGNIIKLKNSEESMYNKLMSSLLGGPFIKRMEEIVDDMSHDKIPVTQSIDIVSIVFILMNKDLKNYKEYFDEYNNLDFFSQWCIRNMLEKNKFFKEKIKFFKKVLKYLEPILNKNDDIFRVNTKSKVPFIEIDEYAFPALTRSESEKEENKQTILENPEEKAYGNYEQHHIFEFNYIEKTNNPIIPKNRIKKALKEVCSGLSKERKEKFEKIFDKIDTYKNLIDNNYNLLPIDLEIHNEINEKASRDPIKKIVGAEINLFMNLELEGEELYLTHIFTGEKIKVADFKAKNNRIKKETIDDFIIYNKIMNKILGTDEFRERFKALYEKYSGVVCINNRENKSQITQNQRNQKKRILSYGL